MVSCHRNAFRIIVHLLGNPPVAGGNVDIWSFLWRWPEQAIEQTVILRVIWGTIMLMWRRSFWTVPDSTGHYSVVIWALSRKSSLDRLFIQHLVPANTKEIIKLLHDWPLVGNCTGYKVIEMSKALPCHDFMIVDWQFDHCPLDYVLPELAKDIFQLYYRTSISSRFLP